VPGSSTEVLAHVADLFPTIADIAGVDTGVLRGSLDPSQADVLDGYSLLPTLADPTVSTGRTLLYAEYFEPGGPGPYSEDRRTIRDDAYKLVVDAACGTELFFAYTPGAVNEGEDLLPLGLTAEQQTRYDQLHAELDAVVAGLLYDASTFPVGEKAVVDCDAVDTGL
jgi:arylsulfatase A-like enzyme